MNDNRKQNFSEAKKKEITLERAFYVPITVLEVLLGISHYVAWKNKIISLKNNNLATKKLEHFLYYTDFMVARCDFMIQDIMWTLWTQNSR